MRHLIIIAVFSALCACSPRAEEAAPPPPHEGTVEAIDFHALLNDPRRPESDRARDASRRPAETLAFSGIAPGWRVADIAAADGYHARLLAGAVGQSGAVFAHNPDWLVRRFPQIDAGLRQAAQDYSVIYHIAAPSERFADPIEAPLDLVWVSMFYHDMMWDGTDLAAFNSAVFNALRPGGAYVIIDHHAESGSGARDAETLHRVDAALVRAQIEAAGFTFDAESNVLANPSDPRDASVFGPMRARTDRFVYRFRKPELERGAG